MTVQRLSDAAFVYILTPPRAVARPAPTGRPD